jgi:hypothetical protein
MAVYSGSERIQDLSELISSIHREVARIAPDSEALHSINEIKLRMSGTSQVQQEAQLREQILSGNPPDYAMAHYALFLIGARLYDEASQFLDKANEVGPFEISPDEVWSYRSNIQAPRAMLLSAKGQLQERPYHVGFLGSVATNLALAGDFRQLLLACLAAQRVRQARQHIAALRRGQKRPGVEGPCLIALAGRHNNRQHRLRQVHRIHRQDIEARRFQRLMIWLETRAADQLALRELHQPGAWLRIQHKDRSARWQGHSPVLKGQHQGIENYSIHHLRCDSRPRCRWKAVLRLNGSRPPSPRPY